MTPESLLLLDKDTEPQIELTFPDFPSTSYRFFCLHFSISKSSLAISDALHFRSFPLSLDSPLSQVLQPGEGDGPLLSQPSNGGLTRGTEKTGILATLVMKKTTLLHIVMSLMNSKLTYLNLVMKSLT
jgi:hypothetical protein